MVEFLNRVAVLAPVRAAFEFVAHAERVVEHGMRQVEEERAFFARLDESNGLVGVEFYQLRRISRPLHDIAISHQRHAALVFEIHDLNGIKIVQQSEIMIEPLIVRQEWFVISQVPFADARRRVAVVLEEFRNRQLVRVNTRPRISSMDPDMVTDSTRVTSGQQASARRAADWSGGVVVGKSRSLLCHRIDPRRLDLGSAITTQIVVTLVIDEDEDDVWRMLGSGHQQGSATPRQHAREQSQFQEIQPSVLSMHHGVRTSSLVSCLLATALASILSELSRVRLRGFCQKQRPRISAVV